MLQQVPPCKIGLFDRYVYYRIGDKLSQVLAQTFVPKGIRY